MNNPICSHHKLPNVKYHLYLFLLFISCIFLQQKVMFAHHFVVSISIMMSSNYYLFHSNSMIMNLDNNFTFLFLMRVFFLVLFLTLTYNVFINEIIDVISIYIISYIFNWKENNIEIFFFKSYILMRILVLLIHLLYLKIILVP